MAKVHPWNPNAAQGQLSRSGGQRKVRMPHFCCKSLDFQLGTLCQMPEWNSKIELRAKQLVNNGVYFNKKFNGMPCWAWALKNGHSSLVRHAVSRQGPVDTLFWEECAERSRWEPAPGVDAVSLCISMMELWFSSRNSRPSLNPLLQTMFERARHHLNSGELKSFIASFSLLLSGPPSLSLKMCRISPITAQRALWSAGIKLVQGIARASVQNMDANLKKECLKIFVECGDLDDTAVFTSLVNQGRMDADDVLESICDLGDIWGEHMKAATTEFYQGQLVVALRDIGLEALEQRLGPEGSYRQRQLRLVDSMRSSIEPIQTRRVRFIPCTVFPVIARNLLQNATMPEFLKWAAMAKEYREIGEPKTIGAYERRIVPVPVTMGCRCFLRPDAPSGHNLAYVNSFGFDGIKDQIPIIFANLGMDFFLRNFSSFIAGHQYGIHSRADTIFKYLVGQEMSAGQRFALHKLMSGFLDHPSLELEPLESQDKVEALVLVFSGVKPSCFIEVYEEFGLDAESIALLCKTLFEFAEKEGWTKEKYECLLRVIRDFELGGQLQWLERVPQEQVRMIQKGLTTLLDTCDAPMNVEAMNRILALMGATGYYREDPLRYVRFLGRALDAQESDSRSQYSQYIDAINAGLVEFGAKHIQAVGTWISLAPEQAGPVLEHYKNTSSPGEIERIIQYILLSAGPHPTANQKKGLERLCSGGSSAVSSTLWADKLVALWRSSCERRDFQMMQDLLTRLHIQAQLQVLPEMRLGDSLKSALALKQDPLRRDIGRGKKLVSIDRRSMSKYTYRFERYLELANLSHIVYTLSGEASGGMRAARRVFVREMSSFLTMDLMAIKAKDSGLDSRVVEQIVSGMVRLLQLSFYDGVMPEIPGDILIPVLAKQLPKSLSDEQAMHTMLYWVRCFDYSRYESLAKYERGAGVAQGLVWGFESQTGFRVTLEKEGVTVTAVSILRHVYDVDADTDARVALASLLDRFFSSIDLDHSERRYVAIRGLLFGTDHYPLLDKWDTYCKKRSFGDLEWLLLTTDVVTQIRHVEGMVPADILKRVLIPDGDPLGHQELTPADAVLIDRQSINNDSAYRLAHYAAMSERPRIKYTLHGEMGQDVGALRREAVRSMMQFLEDDLRTLVTSSGISNKDEILQGMAQLLLFAFYDGVMPSLSGEILIPVLYRQLPPSREGLLRLQIIIEWVKYFDSAMYQSWSQYLDSMSIVGSMRKVFIDAELLDEDEAKGPMPLLAVAEGTYAVRSETPVQAALSKVLEIFFARIGVSAPSWEGGRCPAIQAILLATHPSNVSPLIRVRQFLNVHEVTGVLLPECRQDTVCFEHPGLGRASSTQKEYFGRLLKEFAEEEAQNIEAENAQKTKAASASAEGMVPAERRPYTSLIRFMTGGDTPIYIMALSLNNRANQPTKVFPEAAACFSRIYLPVTDTYETLKERVRLALKSPSHFGHD